MATVKEIINTEEAPYISSVPVNQAILIDSKTLYLSGVIGIDKNTGKLVRGGFEPEMRQVMKHIEVILRRGKSSFDNLIKVTIFLDDMNDFEKMNEIYKEFITKDFPARSAVQMARLPMHAKVEIEAIAFVGDPEGCKC